MFLSCVPRKTEEVTRKEIENYTVKIEELEEKTAKLYKEDLKECEKCMEEIKILKARIIKLKTGDSELLSKIEELRYRVVELEEKVTRALTDYGEIYVTSEPSNARIYLDNEFKQVMTPHTVVANIEVHSVGVWKEGVIYENNPRDIIVLKDRITKVHFKSIL